MKRGTRAWPDPQAAGVQHLHKLPLHNTGAPLKQPRCAGTRVDDAREWKPYCLIKHPPKTVRPGESTISQEWTSHRLSDPPRQDLQCCTSWQREGRRSGLTATSIWGSPQGNGNQNEDARRIPQRVRRLLSHVCIITMCTLPVIWYPAGTAGRTRRHRALKPRSKTMWGASTNTSGWKRCWHNTAKIPRDWHLFIYSFIKDEDVRD